MAISGIRKIDRLDRLTTVTVSGSTLTEPVGELGSLSDLAYLDIHTPTLDEMYAQFLKREDV